MPLSETRMGEIALLCLKQKVREEGIRLSPDIRRNIGNTSKKIGITYAEGFEFAEKLARELVEEIFIGGPGKEPTQQKTH